MFLQIFIIKYGTEMTVVKLSDYHKGGRDKFYNQARNSRNFEYEWVESNMFSVLRESKIDERRMRILYSILNREE